MPDRNEIDVVFLPDWREGNPYLERLAKSVESAGLSVGFSNYPDVRLPLTHASRDYPTARVLHIHWLNDYIKPILWGGSNTKSILHTLRILLDVSLVRLKGVRVVWTVHNLLTHESENPDREKRARRWLMRFVSASIFHSDGAREKIKVLLQRDSLNNSKVIPHGNYFGLYKTDPQRIHSLKQRFKLTDADRVILFFGRLRRYKGVSELIGIFRDLPNQNLKLIVAGKPRDPEMELEIQQAAEQDHRIQSYLGFVPEEDVAPLFELADAAVVPFERTLTSGSAILSLSMGTVTVLPREAETLGLPATSGIWYFDSLNHLSALLNNLPEKSTLLEMQAHNHTAAKLLDWDKIGESTVAHYALD